MFMYTIGMLKANVFEQGQGSNRYFDISKEELKARVCEWIDRSDKRNNVIKLTIAVKNLSYTEKERKRKRDEYNAKVVEDQRASMMKKLKYAGDEILLDYAYDAEVTEDESTMQYAMGPDNKDLVITKDM